MKRCRAVLPASDEMERNLIIKKEKVKTGLDFASKRAAY
jgi:hypothetical protein